MKEFVIVLFSLILLTGCATKYQSVGFTGGYSETKLGENIFQVTFEGNGYTSTTRANDLALLRASELAITNGYKYFIITSSFSDSSNFAYSTPKVYNTTFNGNSATTYSSGGNTFFIAKPSSSNTIICFKDKPENFLLVYDAKFLYESLSVKYGVEK